MPNYEVLDQQLQAIDTELFNRIQELAKIIVNDNPEISGFCMAMGSATFSLNYTENDEDDELDTWESYGDYTTYELINDFQNLNAMESIKEMNNIFHTYNDIFKFTGNPVKINKIAGELRTVYDW